MRCKRLIGLVTSIAVRVSHEIRPFQLLQVLVVVGMSECGCYCPCIRFPFALSVQFGRLAFPSGPLTGLVWAATPAHCGRWWAFAWGLRVGVKMEEVEHFD